jgi:hypothetical protein
MAPSVSIWSLVGALAGAASVLACSGPGGDDAGTGDAQGPVSFRNDLLTAATPNLSFELSCGLSGSCHHEQVSDPKVQRVFLGCNKNNSTCVVSGDVAETVYAGIVGKASQELPSMNYVTKNDPDNSYLVRKLEKNGLTGLSCVPVDMDPIVSMAPGDPMPLQPCGAPMPLGADLSTCGDPTCVAALTNLIDKIRAWISQGAPDN